MISWYADPDLVGHLLAMEHRRDSGEPVRVLLAEGDSWFSIGGATSNLLMALDDADTLIVSCATPGDTLRNISRLGNEPFGMMLSPRFGARWDGVLLSAGGNDLLADVGRVLYNGHLDRDLLGIALEGIGLGYRSMVETVRLHHACPIHAHTYDYPVSDPRGGFFRAGPWIGNRLADAGIARHRHDGLIAELIDGLAAELRGVAALTLHDTRGTLAPGRWGMFGWQRDWKNEIHPTRAGYAQLAAGWRIAPACTQDTPDWMMARG